MKKQKAIVLAVVGALAVVAIAGALIHWRTDAPRSERVVRGESDIPASADAAVIPRSVEIYAQALQATEEKKIPFEDAYIQGYRAMKDLGEVLNDLSDEKLAEARKLMKGFVLEPNVESFTIWQDNDQLIALARKSGTEADVRYFELEKETMPNGAWFAFIDQQTDLSGCTRYDGTLTRLYREWTDYTAKFPKSYVPFVKNELDSIVDALTQATCICDAKVKALQELVAAEKIVSDETLKKKLQLRVKVIEGAGPDSGVSFSCQSNG